MIDTSGSTRAASGIDIDRDGKRATDPRYELSLWLSNRYAEDVYSTDPGDTVLAAEIAAACVWVQQFINPNLFVGVVSFSGPMDPKTGAAIPGEPAAFTVGEITNSPEKIGSALTKIQNLGSAGGTDYSAGIEHAVLLIRQRIQKHPDLLHARKMILFLTDGLPTLPVKSGGVSEPGDYEIAFGAARNAKAENVAVFTFAFGESAQSLAEGLEKIADTTGGSFALIDDLEDLSTAMGSVMSIPETR